MSHCCKISRSQLQSIFQHKAPYYLCWPQIFKLKPRPPSKKSVFLVKYKIEVKMASLIDMLELPLLHAKFWSQDHVYSIIWVKWWSYITISSHGQKLCENAIFICISNNIAKNVWFLMSKYWHQHNLKGLLSDLHIFLDLL